MLVGASIIIGVMSGQAGVEIPDCSLASAEAQRRRTPGGAEGYLNRLTFF